MIRVIIIDDEEPALRLLESLLKNFEEVKVAGSFSDPYEGISAVATIQPDLVFLDVEMPQLCGLDAAASILDIFPKTEIVFITGSSDYAIAAFELYALDYLLKPISECRLKNTLIRLGQRTDVKQHRINRPVHIKCFGGFQIFREGYEPVKFRSERARELLAYLIQNRGKVCKKEELIEEIWPEFEWDQADHMLRNAIYYIRKSLEAYGIQKNEICIKSGYCLKLGDVNIDD